MSQYQIRIKPGGKWHRRKHGSADLTACGEPVLGAVASRDFELDNDLCPECFSRHERSTGEMVRLERQALAESAVDTFEDEEHATDPDAEGLTVIEPKPPAGTK